MEKDIHSCDVCVVCALPEEVREVLEVIQPYCKVLPEECISPRYRYNYRFATITNNEGELLTLHISWLPRYGPQEMMLHLSRVLEEYQPKIAIMTGICAGDSQHVQLGDIVVAERTFTYDNGKFTLDKRNRKVHEHDTTTYQLDANILQFLGLFDEWEPLIARLEWPSSEIPQQRKTVCHLKAMASGSAVRADNPFADVQVPVRDTVAIDMESAAFGMVMNRHPLITCPWLVIKGVCDYADQDKNNVFHHYAARASALYALSFIRAYVTNKRLPSPRQQTEQSSVSHPRILGFLPLVETSLIGRDRLLLQLKQQLRVHDMSSPCIVLQGQSGVGKTTIAAQLARDKQLHTSFLGGVLWADLGQKPSLSSTLEIWASQLGADLSRAITIPEKIGYLQEKLGNGPFLLILDDLWPDDLEALHPLLRMGKPGCALLITTRDRKVVDELGTRLGSKQILIDELDEKAALTLLMELCQGKITDRKLLAPLAKAAGGLPLTLEVMGAYINSHLPVALDPLHIQQKLRRIENYLQLSESVGPRHLPLQKVLDLSINNLPDHSTKQAFFALGAFAPKPATFSKDAMLFVTGVDSETLQILYNRHLLHQVSRDRYTLHQSLLGAARAHLHANDAAWSRHRTYYQKQLEQAVQIGQEEKDALRKIDWRALFSDLPQMRNIRLPQRPASIFSIIINRLSSSIFWLEWLNHLPLWLKNRLSPVLMAGLALLTKGAHFTRQKRFEAILANYQGWIFAEVGDRDSALTHYARAQNLWAILGNRPGLAQVLNNLGKTYYMQANYLQAIRSYHQALSIRCVLDDRRGQAHVLANIGTVLDITGRAKRAIKSFEAALSLYRRELQDGRQELQDARGEAFTLHHLGVAYQGLGEREKALACLEQALAKHQNIKNDVGSARALMELGSVYLDFSLAAGQKQEQDSLETAMHYFRQALALQKNFGDRAWQGRTYSRIGQVYAKQGKTAQALKAYLQALSLHQSVDYNAGLSTTLGLISNLFRAAGKNIWAQTLVNDAKGEHAHYAHLALISKQKSIS